MQFFTIAALAALSAIAASATPLADSSPMSPNSDPFHPGWELIEKRVLGITGPCEETFGSAGFLKC